MIILKLKPLFFTGLLGLSVLVVLLNTDLSSGLLNISSNTPSGEYVDMEMGRLYLPRQWSEDKEKAYDVMIILPGFSASIWSISSFPQWIEGADKNDIVLFFLKRDHMGWYEHPDSVDSQLIRSVISEFRDYLWVREDGISLFGFSAGAIMATSFLTQNSYGLMSKPLVNKICAGSGGFGLQMEVALRTDPDMKKMKRIPLFIFWGEKEPSGVGPDIVEYLKKQNWDIDYDFHSGGHWLDPSHITASIEFSSSNQ